jgi:hypothetical protein
LVTCLTIVLNDGLIMCRDRYAVIISTHSIINVLCFSWSFIRYPIGCLSLSRASHEAREMLLRAAQFQILLIVILTVILLVPHMIRDVASCVSHDLCVLLRR